MCGGDRAIEDRVFVHNRNYQFTIECYHFKMFYVNAIIITVKISTENIYRIKRNEKEIKSYHYKKINKTQRKAVREERRDKKVKRYTKKTQLTKWQ